ncbi:TetR/AcrR family transcriptional regulator [Glutamicibacter sp. NPDC087344]|uniref:TetR/AcrR family transcriptional regulator n=1 Tax=Glutamicibacter sp. NPDC087344 TaxID=3363994 RepID=UPI0038210BA0
MVGIREERKAATQRDIQLAALDLLEAHGLAALTVGQIAQRVGIAERTFFRYFDSKESALLPAEHRLIAALVAAPLPDLASGPQVFRILANVCREHFLEEMRGQGFRRISRLMLTEPGLRVITSRHEQHLVATVNQRLEDCGYLDAMQVRLIGEMLSVTWRVAWQCFGVEERAGRQASPVELFEKAIAQLGVLAGPASE